MHCRRHRRRSKELNVFLFLCFLHSDNARVGFRTGYNAKIYRCHAGPTPTDRPTPPRGARRIIWQKGRLPFRFRKPQRSSATRTMCCVTHIIDGMVNIKHEFFSRLRIITSYYTIGLSPHSTFVYYKNDRYDINHIADNNTAYHHVWPSTGLR